MEALKETFEIMCWVIVGLIIAIIILAWSNVKKSKEIKRLYLNNQLRLALNGEAYLDFKEYPLNSLKLFENKIDDFFLQLFTKGAKEITDSVESINKIKDLEIRHYLRGLMITAINRVEIKKLAELIVANMFDYLHYLKINNFNLSSFELFENEDARYFKFNSFIFVHLNSTNCLEIIKSINELIEKHEMPDFSGNEPMKKWFNEEIPKLLKNELVKLKMYTEK